jgi:hypothetical protein
MTTNWVTGECGWKREKLNLVNELYKEQMLLEFKHNFYRWERLDMNDFPVEITEVTEV